MNRKQRRAARKGGPEKEVIININIKVGRLPSHHPDFGASMSCYLCGRDHLASGAAVIQDKAEYCSMALRDGCLQDEENTVTAVVRKYLNAPDDCEITDLGRLSDDQVRDLCASAASPKH